MRPSLRGKREVREAAKEAKQTIQLQEVSCYNLFELIFHRVMPGAAPKKKVKKAKKKADGSDKAKADALKAAAEAKVQAEQTAIQMADFVKDEASGTQLTTCWDCF